MSDTTIRQIGRFSYCFSWSENGLWYNYTHRDEKITYFFNVGITDFREARIFKIIIGKFMFRIAWERK